MQVHLLKKFYILARTQSLPQGPPSLSREENFQIRDLQLPGKFHSGTIL